MKLTSKNIAIKVLKAKGCLSDTVKRMRGYIEEGDIEKANCARMNALKLASWIDALSRWKPTVKNAYTSTYTQEITSGSWTLPFIFNAVSVNNVIVNQGNRLVLSGGNNAIIDTAVDMYNCPTSGVDDILQTKAKRLSDTESQFIVVFDKSKLDWDSISLESISYGIGVSPSLSVSVTTPVPIDIEPNCLTDEEVLSIIGKIDELCECNC
jgi:hypothetical protein